MEDHVSGRLRAGSSLHSVIHGADPQCPLGPFDDSSPMGGYGATLVFVGRRWDGENVPIRKAEEWLKEVYHPRRGDVSHGLSIGCSESVYFEVIVVVGYDGDALDLEK